MSEQINEQELVQYIAERAEAKPEAIRAVLKYEEAFINNAHKGAKGDVDIDGDELVDYVLSRPDVKLDELTVETILELEMDYLMDKGLAGYVD
ncbi:MULTISPECIES: hypothetical protein [Paenibacillus]|uniref:Uncharacterized protein n=1 Tax=Paenibacillus woosongensis TaxID=307580 RepID=A0ABQ4MS42_9BACL|nr:hypothetical protein [Paenibacillus woosongensis]GIP58815.1 hypothetical protein J15TS10_26290 [Paenibacillus woosongensis]